MQTDVRSINLVLIGGGHSHLFVLWHFAHQPIAGVTVTLISKEPCTLYSGMIPGVIAGHYTPDDASIDLSKLCEFAGINFLYDEVTAVDPDNRQLSCSSGHRLHYDLLSINIGSVPSLNRIETGADTGIAVKPVSQFLERWPTIHQRITARANQHHHQQHITVVGGGAASIEVALAMQYRIQRQQDVAASIRWTLITNASSILPTHNRRVQRLVSELLAARGFHVRVNCNVTAASHSDNRCQLTLGDGESWITDELIWSVHAGSPDWISSTGLLCTSDGFIRVNRYLQSLSHPTVFAAGDIAHFEQRALAKNGVYAVREGLPLARNLANTLQHRALVAFRPQSRFLSLLMLGGKLAIASRGPWSACGRWVWRWKNRIDRQFIRQFQHPRR